MKARIILNPRTLGRRISSLETALRAHWESDSFDVVRTAHPRHATVLARQAVLNGYDTIIAAGGDGTVNEVINGMVGGDAALGIIPAGTANDLAAFCCIPTNAAQAAAVIAEGNRVAIDLICVNGRYYATAGGIGLPCAVAETANKMRTCSLIGPALSGLLASRIYMLSVLWTFVRNRTKYSEISVHCGGQSFRCNPLLVMIDNQPFLGRRFWMSQSAANDDGLFDLCLLESTGKRWQILEVLRQALKRKLAACSDTLAWQCEELRIHADQELHFFGDGEILQKGRIFDIKIVPQALKVIVPRDVRQQGCTVAEIDQKTCPMRKVA